MVIKQSIGGRRNPITNLEDGVVETAALADNAVTNVKVADDAVDTAEIVDGAVGEPQVAPAFKQGFYSISWSRTTIPDADTVTQWFTVPANATVKIWGHSLRVDSVANVAGLNMRVYNNTDSTEVYSSFADENTGEPLVSDTAGGSDEVWYAEMENSSGDEQIASGQLNLSVV